MGDHRVNEFGEHQRTDDRIRLLNKRLDRLQNDLDNHTSDEDRHMPGAIESSTPCAGPSDEAGAIVIAEPSTGGCPGCNREDENCLRDPVCSVCCYCQRELKKIREPETAGHKASPADWPKCVKCGQSKPATLLDADGACFDANAFATVGACVIRQESQRHAWGPRTRFVAQSVKAEEAALREVAKAARAYIDSEDQDRVAEFDAMEAAVDAAAPFTGPAK